MNTKEPELFCRQVNKLIEHGCEITDYEQAIMILNKINYYKLSAYFLPFRDNDGNYKQGTTLLQVYKIYEFDRKLSAFLYGIIQKIEVFCKNTDSLLSFKQIWCFRLFRSFQYCR